MNLLVTSCCAYNSLADWLSNQPSQDTLINAALAARRICHDQYLEDITKFNIKKYWDSFGHNNQLFNPIDSENSDLEGHHED